MCALGRDMQGAIGGALPTSSILGSPAIGGASARAGRKGLGTLLAGGQTSTGAAGGSASVGGGLKPRPPTQQER